jgi:hypothetical protein
MAERLRALLAEVRTETGGKSTFAAKIEVESGPSSGLRLPLTPGSNDRPPHHIHVNAAMFTAHPPSSEADSALAREPEIILPERL